MEGERSVFCHTASKAFCSTAISSGWNAFLSGLKEAIVAPSTVAGGTNNYSAYTFIVSMANHESSDIRATSNFSGYYLGNLG
jgi:hypothetical protein